MHTLIAFCFNAMYDERGVLPPSFKAFSLPLPMLLFVILGVEDKEGIYEPIPRIFIIRIRKFCYTACVDTTSRDNSLAFGNPS